MPIYVYECEGCTQKEEIQRAVEERNKEVVCEKCGTLMSRVFEGVNTSLKFNCSGFYCTDYKKN